MGELNLQSIWETRLHFRAEGDKLWAEGNKLRAEGNSLSAEGSKLCAKGDRLCAKGDKLWTEAVIAVHGNIKLKWINWNEEYQSYECHLKTGEIFGFEKQGLEAEQPPTGL